MTIKHLKVSLMWRGFDLNGVTYDMLLAAYLNDAQIAKSKNLKLSAVVLIITRLIMMNMFMVKALKRFTRRKHLCLTCH